MIKIKRTQHWLNAKLYFKKVKFIPITFKPRQGGVNSINIKRIVKFGWKAVDEFYKLRKDI